jgi:hypothetical protein
MDQAKAGFVATISFRTPQIDVKEAVSARENFWRPIQQSLRREDRETESIDTLESALIANFPRALHRLLMEHFQSRAVRYNQSVTSHPRELYAVFFRTSIEGYSSALLAVDVGGVKELAEVLKGNLDVFTMLMETFVPAGFAGVIPSPRNSGDFVATIAPTAELSRTFAEARAPQGVIAIPGVGVSDALTGETNTGGWLQKAPRALLAAAFSLLTPVVLSLIVLYCAAQMLLQDRSELAKREATIVSQEQDLRKTERSAAADSQKENIELLRLLHTPPAAAPPKP